MEVLQPFMDTLAGGHALQFFYTSTQYNQINHIFLSGGRDHPGLIKSWPSVPRLTAWWPTFATMVRLDQAAAAPQTPGPWLPRPGPAEFA